MLDSIYAFTTTSTKNFVEIKKKKSCNPKDKKTKRRDKYNIVWKREADGSGYLCLQN